MHEATDPFGDAAADQTTRAASERTAPIRLQSTGYAKPGVAPWFAGGVVALVGGCAVLAGTVQGVSISKALGSALFPALIVAAFVAVIVGRSGRVVIGAETVEIALIGFRRYSVDRGAIRSVRERDREAGRQSIPVPALEVYRTAPNGQLLNVLYWVPLPYPVVTGEVQRALDLMERQAPLDRSFSGTSPPFPALPAPLKPLGPEASVSPSVPLPTVPATPPAAMGPATVPSPAPAAQSTNSAEVRIPGWVWAGLFGLALVGLFAIARHQLYRSPVVLGFVAIWTLAPLWWVWGRNETVTITPTTVRVGRSSIPREQVLEIEVDGRAQLVFARDASKVRVGRIALPLLIGADRVGSALRVPVRRSARAQKQRVTAPIVLGVLVFVFLTAVLR